ncbi:aldose epimerase family protein [Nesterenkonia flava]|uniref:Galactose mutarotase n=1 Tax=Nesterenkonia flava TaxID=469799 RepID=A0ABU1FUC4_9MICC|nr:galactose mutarotase [Nesterenkonia flava]MDR5712280.1 galactose mutarotase [Nesterenkonia flava]
MTSPTVTITGGGYEAEIALRGGQLLSLTSQGENLVVPAAQAEGAFAGAVLAPWPNRVAKSTYVYGEKTYELTTNEEETGAAMHGLLYDRELTVQSQRESEVHLAGTIEASEGYPFRLEIVLIYRVAADLGLSTTLMARYAPEVEELEGDAVAPEEAVPAPFGAGFHPYLTAAGAPLNTCRLRLPATTAVTTKASGKVVDRAPVSGDLDLTNGPLLAGRSIDHPFTGLPEEGWTAELIHGPSGLVVRMIADTPWVQVYTGERIDRAGVAVEPMTCPPNAFNSGEDLIHLTPGEWFRVGYSIEAIRL